MPNFTPPRINSRAKGIGFATALASLAQSVPDIYKAYLENEDERKKKRNIEVGTDILSSFETINPTEEDVANVEADTAAAAEELSPQFLPSAGAEPGATQPEVPSATDQMAGSQPDVMKLPDPERKSRWKQALVKVESGGNYQAVGPEIDKFKGKRGYRALGKYQIMPVYHFDKIGLDSTKQEDINRFLNEPKLQDHLFEKVADEMWTGDPRTSSANYYGDGSDKPAPTISGGKAAPTGKSYVDKVIEAMGEGAGEPTTLGGTATAKTSSLTKMESSGAVSEALQEMIKDKPKRPGELSGRTQKKLEYFYKNASPEVIEAMKPTLDALQQMSKSELGEIQTKWEMFDRDADRWSRAVLTAATIEAGLEKSQTTSGTKFTQQNIDALKAKRGIVENQVKLYRDVAKNYADAGKSERERIEKQYPDLFKNVPNGFWRDFVDADPKKVFDTIYISRLQKEIDEIDATLGGLTGLSTPEEAQASIPSTGAAGKKPTGLGNINNWIE